MRAVWRNRATRTALMTLASALLYAGPAAAQQSFREVLSFLVTNRSVSTGDFVRDEEAAQAASDTMARMLGIELSTLPIASSASGFIYRFDSDLGTISRLSESFGPFFTERAMTSGASVKSLSVGYRSAIFDGIDDRNLRDGTLVSTASIVRGEPQPFDVETVSIRVRMDTMTVAGSYGVTDQLEVSAAVPFVRLTLAGERIDTYRGLQVLQAQGSATASGLGDVALRTKYNFVQTSTGGVAVGVEARLATGDDQQLLGAGRGSVKPRLLASLERAQFSLDSDVGYSFLGAARAFDYSGGLGFAATPRLTLVGELYGRRLEDVGRLTETIEPHPRLIGIDTIRLTAVNEATHRLAAVAGFKWNVTGGWLLSANMVRSLTRAGLNARWLPSIALDYAFGQ
jgi:Putative MetA-pathway of phenol degradation